MHPERSPADSSPSDERSKSPEASRDLKRELIIRARRNFARELWDWTRCKRVILPSVGHLREAIAALEGSGRFAETSSTESPIFLLAAGWRSGSTLLQRILVTDPRVLLWGEPLGEMALLSGLAELLGRLSTFPDLAERSGEKSGVFQSLAKSWIATLYPPGSDFRVGLRELFEKWMGQPARQRGFARWGFKEVRLGAAEATLLHWLYPNAKFVLLSRNPYDCYRSLSDSGWDHLYHARPDIRVDSAAGLARHWNRITLSWSELPADFPAYRVKYEDVISGEFDFRALESWLGIEMREKDALSAVVGSTARRHRLGWTERAIISHEAQAGMRALGYAK